MDGKAAPTSVADMGGEGLWATLFIKQTYYSFIWTAAAEISHQWTCQSESPLDAVILIEVPWTWSWKVEEETFLAVRKAVWWIWNITLLNSSVAYNQHIRNRRESVCIICLEHMVCPLDPVWWENKQSSFRAVACLWVLVLKNGNSALLVMHYWSHWTFPSETLLWFT